MSFYFEFDIWPLNGIKLMIFVYFCTVSNLLNLIHMYGDKKSKIFNRLKINLYLEKKKNKNNHLIGVKFHRQLKLKNLKWNLCLYRKIETKIVYELNQLFYLLISGAMACHGNFVFWNMQTPVN